MKILLVFPMLFLSIALSFGQGQVIFQNTSATPITTNSVIGGVATGPISGPMGSYNFALLMAPAGSTDPAAFTYTGISTVNMPVNGMFGGNLVTIQNAEVGASRSFIVRGWSANIGDYNALLTYLGNPTFTGWYGESQIATVVLGGDWPPYPTVLFGSGAGKIPGFNLDMVPEPSALVVGSLGIGVFLLLRRHVRQR